MTARPGDPTTGDVIARRKWRDTRWRMMLRAAGKIFDEVLDDRATLVGIGVNAVILKQGQPPEHLAWLVDLPSMSMRKVAISPGAEDALADVVAEHVIEIDAPADVAGAEQQNGE